MNWKTDRHLRTSVVTIEHIININIPEQYTVDGLQDFNMNIDSPSGTFTSTDAGTDNTLLIKILKVYKNTLDKRSLAKLCCFFKTRLQAQPVKSSDEEEISSIS